MELKKLIYTVEDGIAVIQMNYMKNLNAIDEQMADELMYVVDAVENDPEVRVAVLKGGEKAFSAGGDTDWDLYAASGSDHITNHHIYMSSEEWISFIIAFLPPGRKP